MSVSSLEELLVEELKDIYSAEKQITKALPKLAKATTSQELRDALQSHLQETEGQIERLDQIFEILGKNPRGKTCHGMQGVLEEGTEMIEEVEKSPLRDAGIISAAQRVEHYEMAAYGSAREFARQLGHDDVVALLEATLEEEKAADQKLTTVAQSVNAEAHAAGAEEEEEDDEELDEEDDEELDDEEDDEELDDEEIEDDEDEEEEASAKKQPAKGKTSAKKAPAKSAAKKSKSKSTAA